MSRLRVAVIGAGLAGLACAEVLAAHAALVTLFDKGRSPGGRLATRRLPPHTFDLGAQYFTARGKGFAERVRAWTSAGVCGLWPARIVSLSEAATPFRPVDGALERFVGQPGMSALARHIAAPLDVRSSQRVERIVREGSRLRLFGRIGAAGETLRPASDGSSGERELGTFDRVAVCLPARQAAALVTLVSPALAARAASVEMEPCVAVGWAASDADTPALRELPLDGAFIGSDGARVRSPPTTSALSWVARDSSKPGRPPGERWVLHASSAWSRRHSSLADAELVRALVSEFASLFGLGPLTPDVSVVQRWALARAPEPLGGDVLHDPTSGIGLAGDWVCGGRVEGAFGSGQALAARLLELDAA